MKRKFSLIELVIAPIVLAIMVSWVGNIVSLCRCDFEPPYKAEALKALGIVVPPASVVTV